MCKLQVKSSLHSAGLAVLSKINSGKLTRCGALRELHKTMQTKEFSNILRMGSEKRIDKFEYPLKMRDIQEFVVIDLSRTDERRKKVRFILHMHTFVLYYNVSH